MTLPRAYGDKKPEFDISGDQPRCWSCASCQSVIRDREEVMRQARNGIGVELLGPEKPCQRWAEYQKQKERTAAG